MRSWRASPSGRAPHRSKDREPQADTVVLTSGESVGAADTHPYGREAVDGPAHTPTDADLVRAAGAGDRSAFDALYQRHYARVRGFAQHMAGDSGTAEEVTQAAFVRAYLSLRRLRDGQAFLRWVYRIVVNDLRDRAKAERRHRWIGLLDVRKSGHDDGESTEPEAFEDPDQDPVQAVERQALSSRLRQAIADLPAPFREVVVLHHLQEMDLGDIANTLGAPLGTVKSRLGRARARLRESLSDWFDADEEGGSDAM